MASLPQETATPTDTAAMTTSNPGATPPTAPEDLVRRGLPSWFYIYVVLAALLVIFSVWHGGKFADDTNFRNMAVDAAILLMLAIGATFVIITAGIDLSVSAVLVFSAIAGARVMVNFSGTAEQVRQYEHPDQNIGIPLGLAVSILCGLGWGLVNGLAITKLKLPPFIVTLGTLGMALGFAQMISGGTSVAYVPIAVQEEIGARRIGFYQGEFVFGASADGRNYGQVPVLVILTFAVAIIALITLSRTRFGRYTYAIGSNAAAARRAGINVDRHLIKVYGLSGLLAGLAGAMDVARFATASSSTHSTDNLNAISAVVIGGTSLFGGMGSILGTIAGAFIPTVLRNGLIIGGIDPFWQQVLIGAILIAAVYIDQRRRNAEERM